jgi:hypothetical protein
MLSSHAFVASLSSHAFVASTGQELARHLASNCQT